MKMNKVAIVLVGVGLLALAPSTLAQHEGHQMPGAPATSGNVGACAQNAAMVTGAIDDANARIEATRQLNDPAKMRAAVADLQLMLAQMKRQLADCLALNPSGSSAGSMAAMEHRNTAGTAAPAASPGSQPKTAVADTGTLDISLTSQPSPPRAGQNRFEVTVKDKSGTPIGDMNVSLAFYMPPMPSMNMPAMRNTVALKSAGTGIYRGDGTLGMAGDWDVTISVKHGEHQLGTKTIKLTAR